MYAQNRNILQPKNLKFGINKAKGPKQDNQNLLRSTMPEGILFSLHINLKLIVCIY